MSQRRFWGEVPPVRLPRPPAPEPALGSFILCPVFGFLWPWQQALYAWAFEQAREAARPSLLERDLLAVWN